MPRTVLLVDEDGEALADLRRTLHGSSYRVLSARSTRAALEVLAIEPVHVVVSGTTLADSTGIDLLDRVRLRHPGALRILLDGEGDADAGRAPFPEGAVHFAVPRGNGSGNLIDAIARGLHELDVLHEAQRLLRAVRRQTRERQGCPPPRPR